ncbi:MAG TPA: hypothetical protein VGG89_14485 [Candidatus Baltobacteraceae bacterium]|jgi:hypothetical protein
MFVGIVLVLLIAGCAGLMLLGQNAATVTTNPHADFTTAVSNRLSYLCQHAGKDANFSDCSYKVGQNMYGEIVANCQAYVDRTGAINGRTNFTIHTDQSGTVTGISAGKGPTDEQGEAYIDLMNATMDRLEPLCLKAYRDIAREMHRKVAAHPRIGVKLLHPITGETLNIDTLK